MIFEPLCIKIIDKLKKYSKFIFLLPIVYGFVVVMRYGVNIPFFDDWVFVSLYEYIEKNGWLNIALLKMLFAPHNEHIQFFPRIIILVCHKLTRFNTKFDMFVIQLMVIAVYITCIKYFKKQRKINACSLDDTVANFFVLITGIACFSPIQFGNFIWGFQVGFYMAIFATVISLYYFHQYLLYSYIKHCILSLSFGIIASFSSLHGIIVWPVIFVLISICLISQKGERKLPIRNAVPFIIVGIICYLVYSYGWVPKLNSTNHNIYLLIKYFLSSIGGIYTGQYSRITIILGGATLMLSIIMVLIFLVQRNIRTVLFPIGLIGYSCAALFLIAVGRYQSGIETSAHSRYLSISVLLFIGITMLIYNLFLLGNIEVRKIIVTRKWKNISLFIVMMLFSLFLILGNFRGLSLSMAHSVFLNEEISVLQHYENHPIERLARLYPFATYEKAYNLISILKRYRLNVFSNAIHSYDEISISRINDLKKIELDHYVGLALETFQIDDRFVYTKIFENAWAIDYVCQREYTQVYMKVNDRYYRTADHLPSPDVAEYFGNKHYNNVRFSFAFPMDKMVIGENSFSAIVILNDGVTYYESEVVRINISEDGDISIN